MSHDEATAASLSSNPDDESGSMPSLDLANARIRELELELAQTKLALVETECKNQDLTHQVGRPSSKSYDPTGQLRNEQTMMPAQQPHTLASQS